MNDLLNLFLIIIIFGLVLWLINVFIPLPPAISSLLNLLVLIVLIIYILQFFDIIRNILPPIRILK